MTGSFEVLDAGALTTVQDAGRPGLGHLGVPGSGFLDVDAARLANRLVGNAQDDALLETTGRGPSLRLAELSPGTQVATVGVTGASAPVLIDGRLAGQHAALHLHRGETLTVGRAITGVRSYVAIRGGVRVSPVLGSRSTDLLSGLGPAPVRAGDRLVFGDAVDPVPPSDVVPVTAIPSAIRLDVHLGPRDDWFTPAAVRLLVTASWAVSPRSSRIGLRLTGPRLERRDARELAPEGMVTGAVQVPTDGQPVLLLADHPTTGGYPVIAVVRERDLSPAAQAAPGSTIRFSWGHPAPTTP